MQSEEFYNNLRKAWVFESEKNKLYYDMELESIYILGDFSLECEGAWQEIDNNTLRYNGSFVIDKPKTHIKLSNIEQQGYPFFCGEMELCGKINVPCNNTYINLNRNGISTVRVQVDKLDKTVIADNKLMLDEIVAGEYDIHLTIKNNLHNLLGPHHLEEGESKLANPADFYQKKCIWRPVDNDGWSDGYTFVKTGF